MKNFLKNPNRELFSNRASRRFFNVFLLIGLVGFLVLPNISLANELDNINPGKHLELPEKDAQSLLLTLGQVFTTDWIYKEGSGFSTAEECLVPLVLRKIVRMQALNYLLIDVPVEVTYSIIKNGVKIAKIFLGDISELLEQLEKESVKKAIDYGMKVLLQNEIRITPGAIKFNYDLQKGGTKEVIFQYILIYQPLDNKHGKVAIRFYSPKPIEPPKPEGSTGGIWGIPHSVQGDLPPFIVEVGGKVEKDEQNRYWWIDEKGKRFTEGLDPIPVQPTVKIIFDEPVPDFGIKPLTFWERRIWKPIIAQVKEIEIIITKVTGKSLKIVEKISEISKTAINIWNEVKSFISKIKPFGPAALVLTEGERPIIEVKEEKKEETGGTELPKIVGVEPQQLEAGRVKPRQLEVNPEERQLSLKEMQEKIADVAKKIDALKQRAEELTGNVKPRQLEEKKEEEKKKEEKEKVKKEEIKSGAAPCLKNPNAFSQRNKVIFNEIAWMGSQNSANDEWIELKNISGTEIDLTGWQILDKDQQIKIIFGRELFSTNGFYLLERTNDDSVPQIKADLIYTGGLSNTNEALYLFNENCQLQDEVLANPNWPAGNNSSKRTMERRADLNWQTSLNPGGTPKRENTSGYVAIPAPVTGGGGTGGSSGGGETVQPQISLSYSPQNPVNKEIEITLSASNLKNATYDVKISIEKGTTTLSEIFNQKINDWQSSTRYTTSTFSGISFSGNFKLKIKDTTFRGEADIFAKIRESGKTSIYTQFSGKINITSPEGNPTQNQPPTASFIFSPQNPFINEEIFFNAASSTDAIISYLWNFGDNATSAGATTSHTFLSAGTSTVILLVTDNQGATSSTSTIIFVSENPNVVKIPTYVLITEVRAVGSEEFVELYNPTDEATSTAGWYLSYFSSTKNWNDPSYNKSFSKSPTTTIPAKSYFLVGFGGYNDPKMDWKADGRNLSDTKGAIGIFSCNPEIATTSTTTIEQAIEQARACKIDALGWGNAIVKEGTSIQSTTTEKSFARKIATTSEGVLVYADSDDNSQDFEIQEPTPKAINHHPFSDLDGDGIIDSYDSTTTIAMTIELKAGEYKFKDLVLINGGKLVLNSSTTLTGFQGVKILAENLIIDASSAILANGKGYPSNEGPGKGGMERHDSGGSYGGIGGFNLAASTYGSPTQPTDLGSGGGVGYFQDSGVVRPGGAGGGAIIIEVNGSSTIDGIISANGQDGLGRIMYGASASGGGSGGSIYLQTNALAGSGKISANGGNTDSAGAGGGGRIAVYYQQKDFNGEIQSFGGKFYYGGSNGGAGTIYLKQDAQNYGDLIIDNNGHSGTTELLELNYNFSNLSLLNSAHLYFAGNLTVGNIQIKNNSILETATTSQITVSQNFIIEEKSSLIGPSQIFLFINVINDLIIQSESRLIGNFNIQTGNFTLATSSLILASGKGYPSNEGPGKGGIGRYDSGGSYGGLGGFNVINSIYGSSTQPTDLGSGGGGTYFSDTGRPWPGGSGGGAIIIEVNGSSTIDGIISANGESGLGRSASAPASGAGSGGSIYFQANVLTGSGTVSAKGGDVDSAGAGGGGRITLYYSSNEFSGKFEAFGGVCRYGCNTDGSNNGGAGTIYLKSGEGEELITTGEASFPF